MPHNRDMRVSEHICNSNNKNIARIQACRGWRGRKKKENMIWERKQQVGSSSRISHWNVCCLLSNWILRGVETYIREGKEKFHFRLLSAINGDSKKAY